MIESGITAPDYALSWDFRLRRKYLPIIRQIERDEEIEFLKRRPEIDGVAVKTKDKRHLTAGEVADNNWRIMKEETVKAWQGYLEEFFPNGWPGKEEINIFSLSSYGGLEAGGISNWCLAHDLQTRIEIYNLMTNKLEGVTGLLKNRRNNLVIAREPGPFGGEENRELWQKIFSAIAATEPEKILISSDDCRVRDYGMGIGEVELITKWLSELGYTIEKPLTTYNLQYPSYLYGIQDIYWYLRIVDRVKVLYKKSK